MVASQGAAPTTPQHGLLGKYYQGIKLQGAPILTQIDPIIDFQKREDFPVQNKDMFSVRWTGKLHAPESGEYTFHTRHDDGARLWIDNVCVIDQWEERRQPDGSGKITLEKDRDYEVRLEYFQFTERAEMQLSWEYGQKKRHIVPSSVLLSP